MNYIECQATGTFSLEIVAALLWQWPFESILEEINGIKGYIREDMLTDEIKQEIKALEHSFDLQVSFCQVPDENWNAVWESSFQPVSVGDFCYIRADFHPSKDTAQHQILINPKMAFGTAHHETTYMMIEMMEGIDFEKKLVFDYGTGTGILAILGEKMGASSILAMDYDPKSTENAIENSFLNQQKRISVVLGEASDLATDSQFDVVLANINFNVLMEHADRLGLLTIPEGKLLLSGILTRQQNTVIEKYVKAGFMLDKAHHKGDWSCLLFEKVNK